MTGNNRSSILGTLGTLGTLGGSQPNLFLINPNGIIFGKNASLDVAGSFVGSTAESIKFADGSFFRASEEQKAPLLKISVPLGLQIPQNPGKITVQGDGHNLTHDQSTNATIRGDVSGLETRPGKTLALVGGDIAFYGGNLKAESGRIELGSVASPGLVNLIQNDSGLTLGYSGIEDFGDIQLSQKASVDASGEGGGSIQVQSERLSLKDGSSILSITSGAKTGGNFTVNATESVELIGESVDGNYASSLLTESQGTGTSGNLTVNTGKLTTTDGAYLSTFITSSGNGGNLTVKASDSIELVGEGRFGSGLYTGASSGSSGNAGELNVETGNLTVKNNARVYTTSDGLGNSGDILIQASDGVSVSDAPIMSIATNGSSGDIEINANSLSLAENSQLDTSTFGNGNGGDITVNARQTVSFSGGSMVNTTTFGNGNGGDITVNANQNISLTGDSIVSSGNFVGKGNGGNIQLTTETFRIDGASIFSGLINAQQGNGGNIEVNTGSLFLTNGGSISSSIHLDENFIGESNAGNIAINARDRINLDGLESLISTTLSEGKGRSGNIEVNTGTLSVVNGAQLFTSSAGNGNAGNITINARDTITFDGFGIYKNNDGTDRLLPSSANSFYAGDTVGNGGDIRVTGKALFLTNGGLFNAINFEQGNGGNIYLDIRDKITIDGVSSNGITTGPQSGLSTFANTNGGEIQIETGTLKVTNGGVLSSFAKQNGGDITVDARDAIIFDDANGDPSNVGSGALSVLNGGKSKGKAGDIKFTSKSLTIANGASLASNTSGQGNAGNILINVRDKVTLDGVGSNGRSRILSTVENQGIGNGGNVEIRTNSLSVINGAQINSSTFGEGNAGNIKVNADDFVTVSGMSGGPTSGLFVDSASATGTTGNIIITSPKITLDNGGTLEANSASVNGGNINLTVNDLLLMRRGAQISTDAGTARQGGDGGNIDINSKFIIAIPQENSDITANAFSGKGGNVQINSQGIFGIEARSQQTSESDITASSDLGVTGNINLNTPDNSGIQNNLRELPENQIDTNTLISQSCIARSDDADNTFTITGSGGFPDSPGNANISTYPTNQVRGIPKTTSRQWKKGDPIVEPDGVYRLADGRLALSRECR